ncbi:Sas10/Utp3/C1D [Neofusicoccum parvum]|uniref:Sas10/Utp3/C1D n=1 Tax=Neofusicoccum parvum TaxID=310453 RepID=A0ACB5S4Z4_9PEZI|nr:Sas10/Utp3/C1D [Neofusicoccum parvum]
MDITDLHPQVEALADNIDDLEEALGPLLQTALSAHASKLPLLDKAKLYTLVTYAIESILFSYLSLNGVKAKEHAVFTELVRVRQYFQKIKQVEDAPMKPNQTLDKAAATRFIKAGLAGNDQYDKERALRQAKERAQAHMKLQQLSKKRKADETDGSKESAEMSSEEEEAEDPEAEEPHTKRSRRAKASDMWDGEGSAKKDKKKGKKGKKQNKAEGQAEELEEGEEGDEGEESSGTRKKKSGHVPLGHKAAFQALLQGPIPKRDEQQQKKKGKGKRKSKA